jgi:glutathione synthase/RimK-type ligase-like ATP-grasp enzyme
MSRPSVVVATATRNHKVDLDQAPLVQALEDRGVNVRVLPWDDKEAQPGFAAAKACLLRSTWNYVQNYERFLPWIDWCAGVTALWNPATIVRWNSHKRYLLELETRGIPIVPTKLYLRGQPASVAELNDAGADLVIKPAVSAGSFGTIRSTGDHTNGLAHLLRMLAERDMLVQRYQPSVDGYGERALVCIDGELSHAVRKGARFAGQGENVSADAVPVADDERALAARVLAAVPSCAAGSLLYARVDLVRDEAGQPRVMELELIEPSLFFGRHPPAAALLAAALVARL